ncbi:MAG: hypothetical protein B7Z20_02730 [Sphingobium sp. 32-64-5]|nr:MAG: hypothetical protein B7Z20_02730 [Sphingobium sp. 32-64-5]
MHLHQLSSGRPATIDRVEWDHLSPGEAQRLREFGVEEGATVEILHRAGFLGKGAITCRIGRMTIAMRHIHASAIQVHSLPEAAVATAPVPQGLAGKVAPAS